MIEGIEHEAGLLRGEVRQPVGEGLRHLRSSAIGWFYRVAATGPSHLQQAGPCRRCQYVNGPTRRDGFIDGHEGVEHVIGECAGGQLLGDDTDRTGHV